ncbi:hypothetical protein BT96DRAFT_748858, partial [Gymnopus androsaceus JB14]
PFLANIELRDGNGKTVEEEGMVDDGAMVNAIDLSLYEALKQKIGGWKPTTRRFRMANGSVVPGKACWEGEVRVGGLDFPTRCEVFSSRGSWKVLIGKPLLEQLHVVHNYNEDSLQIK